MSSAEGVYEQEPKPDKRRRPLGKPEVIARDHNQQEDHDPENTKEGDEIDDCLAAHERW